MNRTKHNTRIAGLTGLRAIACLAIVFYHMLPEWVPGGFLGVCTFFVLSGYLMALTTLDRPFSLWTYWKKRILRIYPALLVTLSATLVVTFFTDRGALAGCRPELLSILLGYNNLYQIHTSADYFTRITGTSPFTHLWTLALELQYYLLWPLLLAVCKKWRKAGRVLLLALTFLSLSSLIVRTLLGEDLTRLYYGTDTRLFSLTFGSLLATVHPKRRRGKERPRDGLLGIGTLALFVILFLGVEGRDTSTYLFFLGFATFLAGLQVLLCSMGGESAALFDLKPLSLIGDISYEIYLVMYPVLFFLAKTPISANRLHYALLSLALIFPLAILIHLLTTGRKPKPGRKRKKSRSWLPKTVIIACLCAVGLGIALTAPEKSDSGDLQKLQAELEENAALLAEEKEEAATAETTVGESTETITTVSEAVTTEETTTESTLVETTEEVTEASTEETTETTEETTEAAAEETTEAEAVPADYSSYTFIGDSVMLGAAPSLLAAFPGCTVDAVVSRQVWEAKDVIDDMRTQGTLGTTVVLGLGANGTFARSVGEDLLADLGADGNTTVYWILPYGQRLSWQAEVCNEIEELAKGYDFVTIIDWPATASEHSEWFYDDGMHLNAEGQKGYASFLYETIVGAPLQREETAEETAERAASGSSQ